MQQGLLEDPRWADPSSPLQPQQLLLLLLQGASWKQLGHHHLPDLQPFRAFGEEDLVSPVCLVTCKIRYWDAWTIFTSPWLSCRKVANQLFASSQDFSASGCHKKSVCCLQCLPRAPTKHYALLFVVTKWWRTYRHPQKVKLLQTLGRKLRIGEKVTTGVLACITILRWALETRSFSWVEQKNLYPLPSDLWG